MSDAPILVAAGVSKRFGGVRALHEVDLEIEAAAVHGLVGPNGAGKSTLVNVLTGRVQPDIGSVRLRGETVRFRRPRESIRQGIAAVPQELAVPPHLSVADFVTLGAEPRRLGFVARGRARRAARAALDQLGVEFALDALVGTLSPSAQKTLIVAQALHRRHAVVILDEPTAGMTADHAAHVLGSVEILRREGVAVLYISHRFAEIQRLCDRVTLMRDGARVDELVGEAITIDNLVRGLAKHAVDKGTERGDQASTRSEPSVAPGQPRVEISELTIGRARKFSFTARTGEIVGLAGLPGSGVEEVFAALTGRAVPEDGRVRMDGRELRSARDALRRGVAYLPPSRSALTLPARSVCDNIVLGRLSLAGSRGFVTHARELRLAKPVGKRVGVMPLERRMRDLSGGNQQRALLGRLLFAGGDVLVLEDPTVGVDVAARAALHALIREFATEGRTCVIGSSEPEELVELCGRVLVLRRGSVVATLEGADLTAEALVLAMTGGDAVRQGEKLGVI